MSCKGTNPFVFYLFLLISWSYCQPTPQTQTQLKTSQAHLRRLIVQLFNAVDEAHLKYAKAHKFYPGDSPIPPYPYILSFFLPSNATLLPQTLTQLTSQWSRQNASARFQLCTRTLTAFTLPLRQIRGNEFQHVGETADSTVAVRKLEEKFLRQTVSALKHVVSQTGMTIKTSVKSVDLSAMKRVVGGIATRNDFTQWTAVELRNYGILEALRDLVQSLKQRSICEIRQDDIKKLPS